MRLSITDIFLTFQLIYFLVFTDILFELGTHAGAGRDAAAEAIVKSVGKRPILREFTSSTPLLRLVW